MAKCPLIVMWLMNDAAPFDPVAAGLLDPKTAGVAPREKLERGDAEKIMKIVAEGHPNLFTAVRSVSCPGQRRLRTAAPGIFFARKFLNNSHESSGYLALKKELKGRGGDTPGPDGYSPTLF